MAVGTKLVSMAVAVLSVPILLRLLGVQDYGTWVTLTSLIAFISLLDLGVGNNLRNAVASATDTAELARARDEFVGFFQLLIVVSLCALLLFAVSVAFSSLLQGNLSASILLYGPLLLMLPTMLGASVLQGYRATGLQAMIQASSSWMFFLLTAAFAWAGRSVTLPQLSIGWSVFYSATAALVFGIALRVLRLPLSRLTQWRLSSLPKERLRIGLEFLALQLSSLVLYGLGNALIYHSLGADEVARYDVLNKIFQVALSFFTIIIGVMWTEIARHRAHKNRDALWRIYRRLWLASVASSLAFVGGALAAPWIIDHWTHHRLQVSSGEALAVALLACIQSMAYAGAVFMNAFERIRLQVMLAGVSIVLMIPLSLLLMRLGAGIAAVPLAAAALTLLPALACNGIAVSLIRSVPAGAGHRVD